MATSSKHDKWTYDVFVSFRGEDIRKSFMDHLFKDFEQKGIQAFRDDKDLRKGEVISLELYKAIEQSRFLIVIFSRNYASSSWCLRELVKILECKDMENLKYEVRIIFYDVKPDVVRKQTESYAEAFAKHVVLNNKEVAKWKEALFKAANLSGWDLQDLTNGYEAKFTNIISEEILSMLRHGPLHVGEKLVGVDAHVKKLDLQRFVGSNKVNMFGICGFSGIGKTTLAKAIYNSMYKYFEGSCFCDDVGEKDLTQVQMQLINNIMKTRDVKIWTSCEGSVLIKQSVASKPILLVLDNVNHHEQVEALAGSPDWFSPGSLIIFTGNDKQMLRSHDVEIYDMPFLPHYEAYKLFCLQAFGQKYPTGDFKELAHQVVKHLEGHPLALKVFGRCLYEKPAKVWKSKLDRLQTYLNADIKEKLQTCLDGLDFDQKRTFLDIACSFVGEKKDFAVNILDDSDCFAEDNIDFLVDRSLITISHEMSIQMHELIRSMAREIVREESNVPGNRSRLWGQSEEVYRILSEKMATEEVEVIDIWNTKSSQKFDIDGSAFSRMNKLRILKLPRNPNVYFSGRLKYLSNNLKYLCWHGCPFKFLPSDFYPENIVAIDLSYSHLKNLWATPKCFTRLKVLKLSHCHNLANTPDFTHITNLEELILEGCVSLVEVHPSVGMLKSLVVLNMQNCKRLKTFPCKLEMNSLQILNLSGCLRVDNLPQELGGMKRLLELRIDRTAITRLPLFVSSSINLLVSSFGQHERFWSRWWTTISQPSCLPQSLVLSSLASLPLLRSLNLWRCNILRVLENIGGLSCLEELDLSGNSFTSLPESLSQLSSLKKLYIRECKKLEVFPKLPPSIAMINASYCNISEVAENIGALSRLQYLDLSGNRFTSLPESFSQLSSLDTLHINNCKKLEVFPKFPPSIGKIDASYCNISEVAENIGALSRLQYLDLSGNSFTSLPESFSQLSSLDTLQINNCKKLEVFPKLTRIISFLIASGCPKLVESNFRIESEEPQPSDTCMTSDGFGDKLSPLLRYLDNQICKFFYEIESYPYEELFMMYNGNEIPEWFPNQCIPNQCKFFYETESYPYEEVFMMYNGNEIPEWFPSHLKVEIPPDWCYNKFKGFAFCVVFTPKTLFGSMILFVNNFDGAYLYDTESLFYRYYHDSDMIWLGYVGGNRRWKEAKDFVTFSTGRSIDKVTFIQDDDVEVKKIGVRLVYGEDEEDMDSSLIKHYLSTTTHPGGLFTSSTLNQRYKHVLWKWY